MRVLRTVRLSQPLVVFAMALAVASVGCTTIDPETGEQKIDPLPTAAAVAGTAAAGALIWSATNDDDNDDNDHHHHGGHGYRPFSPTPGVYCYPDRQTCYNEDGYAKKWTRRVFGD